MPSGHVHSAATTSIIMTVATIGFVAKEPIDYAYICAGAFANYFMSPDLDVDAGFIGFSYFKKIPMLGWAVSWVWRMVWMPYALAISHRSWLSHFPIISTVLRIGYLYAIVAALAAAFGHYQQLVSLVSEASGIRAIAKAMWLSFYGLCLTDTSHYVLDRAEPDQELLTVTKNRNRNR